MEKGAQRCYTIGRIGTLKDAIDSEYHYTLESTWSMRANMRFVSDIIMDMRRGGTLLILVRLLPHKTLEESLVAELTLPTENKATLFAKEINAVFDSFKWNLSIGVEYVADIMTLRAHATHYTHLPTSKESKPLLAAIKKVVKQITDLSFNDS